MDEKCVNHYKIRLNIIFENRALYYFIEKRVQILSVARGIHMKVLIIQYLEISTVC